MKSIVIAISSLLLLFLINVGCSSTPESSENVDPETENKDTIEILESDSPLTDPDSNLLVDRLIVGKYKVIVTQTDETMTLVDSHSKYEPIDEKKLLKTTSGVNRNADALLFTLRSGENVRLTDVNISEDEGNFLETVSYQYEKTIKNYWQLKALCYEYHFTVIMNQITGDTIRSIAPGAFSPSNDLLFCSNIDMESQFTPNGIEIYELSKGYHSKIGFARISNWGLKDLVWISDTKLTATRVDVTDRMTYELRNVTIELIER